MELISIVSKVLIAKPVVVYHDLRFPNVARQCDMERIAPLLLVSGVCYEVYHFLTLIPRGLLLPMCVCLFNHLSL